LKKTPKSGKSAKTAETQEIRPLDWHQVIQWLVMFSAFSKTRKSRKNDPPFTLVRLRTAFSNVKNGFDFFRKSLKIYEIWPQIGEKRPKKSEISLIFAKEIFLGHKKKHEKTRPNTLSSFLRNIYFVLFFPFSEKKKNHAFFARFGKVTFMWHFGGKIKKK